MTAGPVAALAAAVRGEAAADDRRVLAEHSHVAAVDLTAAHLADALSALGASGDAADAWLRCALDSFEPDRFALNLRRLVDSGTRPGRPTERLAALLSGSQYLADAACADPQLAAFALSDGLVDPPDALPPPADAIADAVAEDLPEDAARDALAAFKLRETMRLTLADLTRAWPTPAVLARISDLASAVVDRALTVTHRRLVSLHGAPANDDPELAGQPADFVVLGMGKLGGRELNYSSDIDLIYLYRTEQGRTAGGSERSLSNPLFYGKLAQQLTRTLQEPTPFGPCYRVDLELRPGGAGGDAAIGLKAAEIYYEYWGATWERQAMLRGRGIAGSPDLAEMFFARITPFLWKRTLDYREIDEIRDNKRRIAMSLQARRGDRRDLKLSRGGIREVEFVVQAFQLIYGGKHEALRVRGTVETIDALAALSLLPEADARELKDAYLFLREVENRVQALEGRQTHNFPDDAGARAALARMLGLGAEGARESAARIEHALAAHRARVAAIFDDLFPNADEELSREVGSVGGEHAPGPASDEGLADLLSRRGFSDPPRAIATLRAIRDGQPGERVTAASRSLFERILPRLVETAGALPDPQLALGNLEKFTRALRSREALFQTLSDSPEWSESLLTLLGSSEYLSAILIAQPEFLESTFRPEFLGRAKTGEEIDGEFAAALERIDDVEDAARELRRLKRAEELRVGLRSLLGQIDIRQTMRELTALADATVCRAYHLAVRALTARGRAGAAAVRFGVFLLGSAGARELVFNSDLDLLYVYDESGDGPEPVERMALAAEIAEKTTRYVAANLANGFAYRVDLRLRPEGESGPLAVSLASLGQYLETRASWWERQSLMRLRPVADPVGLAGGVLALCRNELARVPFTAAALSEIVRMRDRIADERGKKGARFVDLKMGAGGLIDAEFAAQMLLLANWDPASPDRTAANTIDVLTALHAAGRICERDLADLSAGFLLQKKMENQLRLTYERPVSHLDKRSPELVFVARLSGFTGPNEDERMLTELAVARTRVRDAYTRVIAALVDFLPG